MAAITQQEFNQMLAVAIAGGLGGGTYISRWDGEEIDDLVGKILSGGGFGSDYLLDGAVTTPKLADRAVTTAKMADSAVTSAKLGSSAVTEAKIASSAVTSTKLASSAVTEAKIASGAVTTAKLADGAVTWDKLAAAARPIRPNLLDNSYFVGGGSQQGGGQFPINQRGGAVYTAVGYGIDRWRDGSGAPAVLSTVLNKEYLSLSGRFSAQLIQSMPDIYRQTLAGKTLTFSILCKGIGPEGRARVYDSADYANLDIPSSDQMALHQVTFTMPAPLHQTSSLITVRIYPSKESTESGTLDIKAVKLELGDTQTLARQDASGKWVLNGPLPDFEMELLRCQRYFQVFATQSQRPTKGADFRPVMRTETPTLGTITMSDGTVLYTASSEL